MSTFLVTQATGEQSRWVITHLLAAGAKVHAVVRDINKVHPLLQQSGVKLFQGESKNFDDIFQAAQGCSGAFLNTFPIPGLETLQAETIIEAAKKAGVETLVASTTFLTGRKDVWDNSTIDECLLRDYYTSKAQVENLVRNANFKAYTIVRPSILHQDFLLPGAYGNYPQLPRGILDHAFDDGVKAPLTDAQDVGRYVAAALQDPAKFNGQEIELANENLTMEEARDILARISGRDVKLHKRTAAEVEEGKAAIFGQRFQIWSNFKDFSKIITTSKESQDKFGIPFTPLEASMLRDKARLLECLPASSS